MNYCMNSYECITCVRDKEKDEECKQTIYCHRSKHQDGRCCILQEVEYVWNNKEEPVYNPPTTESSVQHLFNSKRRVSVLLCPLTNLIICEPETRPSEVYTSIGL